jgi:hypothetical protein
MVGRISPPTPDPGTHQHCSETLRTARYPLFFPHEPNNSPRHLHHAAPIFLLFSAASVNFPSPRRCTCTLHHSRRSDVRTCKCATLLFTKACRLFVLYYEPSPFVFSGLQPLFGKHPGGGYVRIATLCNQQDAGSFLVFCASSPHSVLNSRLSCSEAGQP